MDILCNSSKDVNAWIAANTIALIIENFLLLALSNTYCFIICKAKDTKKLRVYATLASMHVVLERVGLSAF